MLKNSYSTWGPSYKVSFSLNIKKIPKNQYTNIIHVTKGGNWGHYGDRIPAVWILSKWGRLELYICTAITFRYRRNWKVSIREKKSFCKKFNVSLEKKYDVTIQQSKQSGHYWYQLFVSGERNRSFVNYRPKKFNNVKCYTSDPWFPSFTSDLGTVSNLKIENQ